MYYIVSHVVGHGSETFEELDNLTDAQHLFSVCINEGKSSDDEEGIELINDNHETIDWHQW